MNGLKKCKKEMEILKGTQRMSSLILPLYRWGNGGSSRPCRPWEAELEFESSDFGLPGLSLLSGLSRE